MKNKELLYQNISEKIYSLIKKGVWKAGEKLPSVRTLCHDYRVSPGTVFKAYYILESQGMIESRLKSGYFVRYNAARIPSVPAVAPTDGIAYEVNMDALITELYRDISADDVLKFSVAAPAPELLPSRRFSKSVQQALRNSSDGHLNYAHLQGNVDLRRRLAMLAFSWGGSFNENDIIVTAGCMEAIVFCLETITKPGDSIAIESPTYFGILQAADKLNLKVVEIPTDPINGPDIDYMETLMQKKLIRASVLVSSFNNPLGACMPDADKQKLVLLHEKYQIPLVEDDVYGELYFDTRRPATFKSFDKSGIVLYCSSFSKSLAPGYRIGWAIPGNYTSEIIARKFAHTISGNSLSQAAMAHFLEFGRYEFHMSTMRKALHTQCLRYLQAIHEYFPVEIRISRPRGGFVIWIELQLKINALELYRTALKHQIAIAPGHIFSVQNKYANCIRISFARPYDALSDRGMKKLGELIKNHISNVS